MKYKKSVIVGVLAAMLFVVVSAAVLILRQQEQVVAMPPWEFSALAAANGKAAARTDLENGVRQVRLPIMEASEAEQVTMTLRSFGYTSRDPGCIVDGDEDRYWNAYNRVMIQAGRKQFGEGFTVAFRGD